MTFNHTMSGFGFSTGTLAYGVKGNQTSRPATLSAPALNLDWNFDNQLRGADTNGSAGSLEVTFEYDALGRRVSRSHSSGNVVYVHAGQQVIADYARGAVTSSPTYRYVYADYVDEPILRHTGTTTTLPTTGDNALYYHRNQQYSIVGLTNAAGTLVERYTYSAYGTLGIYAANGTVRSSSTYANRYTYTGREWDAELRLYHFRARWYDPATGEFISRDPLGYVDGMSVFRSYFGQVKNDPTGLFTIEEAFFNHCNEWCTPARRKGLTNCWNTCKETQLCGAFKTWVKMEKQQGQWWEGIPRCPCSLNIVRRRCVQSFHGGFATYFIDTWVPPSDEWKDPSVPTGAEKSLHPGAVVSMRTKKGPRFNQCIYDSLGKLMTGLPSAGTVDYEPAGTINHYYHDVYPIMVANYCDGGKLHNFWGMAFGFVRMRSPAGENVKQYYEVRPHWAEDCTENPPQAVTSPIPVSIPTQILDRRVLFPDGYSLDNGK